MPASAAVISHILSTPLTIGGKETIELSKVEECIWFNPKTDDIGFARGDSSTPPSLTSGLILLRAKTIVAGDPTESVEAVALGINTRFMALGSYSGSMTEGIDLLTSLFPERLDAGRSIGVTSNWGVYDPLTYASTTIQLGQGNLVGPDVTRPFPVPVPSSQLWGSGARGSVGFVMDAFVSTGNMINGPEQTDSSTWASQDVAEYVQIPEYVPSFEHALYGWAEIGMDASGTTLYGFAYDDSGASIDTLAVGSFMDVSAVPEPANALTLASLLGGSLLLRSRRRAPASVADARAARAAGGQGRHGLASGRTPSRGRALASLVQSVRRKHPWLAGGKRAASGNHARHQHGDRLLAP